MIDDAPVDFAQPETALTDQRGVDCDAVWFDIGEGEGVLELPKGAAGDVLELVLDAVSGCTVAWWESEQAGSRARGTLRRCRTVMRL